MTDLNIDKAVEAAAEAIKRHGTFTEAATSNIQYGYAICNGCGERRGDREGFNHAATAALSAALPHIRAALADVMEGILDAKTPVDTSDAAVSRDELARAWDEGHQEPWKRGMDDCQCGAWASIECGCGKYGTGELLSLTANPYRPSGDER